MTYPFRHSLHGSQTSTAEEPKKQSPEPARKGISRKIRISRKKYGSHKIPKNVKTFLKNTCQISEKWKKYFIKTGLAFLAKWTWAKYASAYNSFFRFCKDEKIKNPWPISKNSTVCFVLWCKKVLKIKARTIQNRVYFSLLLDRHQRVRTEVFERRLIEGASYHFAFNPMADGVGQQKPMLES